MTARRWLRQYGWSRIGLPLIVYALIVVFITWPLATHLNTDTIGSSVRATDDVEHVRMIWWVKYALQHGLNPFYQSLFGYPDGFFSAIQWAQPLVYWPAGLLSFIVGIAAAYDLWIMIVLVLDGLTAYWLCLELLRGGRDDEPTTWPMALAALLGGAIFMTFPATQSHLMWGHINIVSNYGLPVLAWSLYRILNGRGTLRTAIIGALAGWAVLLGNYTGIVYLLLPLVLFGALYLLFTRRKQLLQVNWRVIRQLVIVFGGCALLSLPFYLPLLVDATNPAHSAYLDTQSAGWVMFSTDLSSFLAPSPLTPWLKPFVPYFSYTIFNTNKTEGTAYLGLVAAILAIVAIGRQRKGIGPWLTILLGSMLFSLGPMLKWNEQPVVYTLGLDKSNIVLPWALFQNLPVINLARTPGRFNVTTGLALGILAAFGLESILRRVPKPSLRVALSGALLAASVAEYQMIFPFATHPIAQAAYFDQLANRDDIRAVFDVPFEETTHDALLEQIQHHKPIIGGYYARLTPVDPAKLTLLSQVSQGLAWTADSTTQGFPGKRLAADDTRTVLKDNGIDLLVYHWAWLANKASTMDWAVHTFGQPTYQDSQISVFEVPPPSERSTSLAMTHEANYWWPYQPPTNGFWIDADTWWLAAGWRLVVYAPQSTLQQIAFNVTPLIHARSVTLTLDGDPFNSWSVAADPVNFWLPLKPGFHTLQFTVLDGCTPVPIAPSCLLDGESGSRASCSLKEDDRNVCVSMRLNGLQTSDSGLAYEGKAVDLDAGLTLRGFRAPDQARGGTALPVETDWHAAQKLPGDYHMFMHLFSLDGKLGAQHDSVPAEGAFPTAKWSASQDWDGVVTLNLPADIAPGSYELYVGWYRYPDMTRLGVHSDSKHAVDGLVYLKTITIS